MGGNQYLNRTKTVTVRMSQDNFRLLSISAAIKMRTNSSFIEWLLVQHFKKNEEAIEAFRSIRTTGL